MNQMMNKLTKILTIFMIIAFLLPLLIVIAKNNISNNAISFAFYGIQAAAPSISAIVVLAVNKELRTALSRLFHKKHLTVSFLLPTAIICVVMFAAKLLSSLIIGEFQSFFETVSYKQFIMILWAFVAEEFGWRGFLEPALNKLIINQRLVPGIVGLIWFSWHYHYFMQNSIEIPIFLFLIGCIIESYIYSFLMRVTKYNLVSAMTFHFLYNLMIHVMAINPSDNSGSLIPYTAMIIMETVVLFVLILRDAKAKNY